MLCCYDMFFKDLIWFRNAERFRPSLDEEVLEDHGSSKLDSGLDSVRPSMTVPSRFRSLYVGTLGMLQVTGHSKFSYNLFIISSGLKCSAKVVEALSDAFSWRVIRCVQATQGTL